MRIHVRAPAYVRGPDPVFKMSTPSINMEPDVHIKQP